MYAVYVLVPKMEFWGNKRNRHINAGCVAVFSAGNVVSSGVSPTKIKLQMPTAGQAATASVSVARDTTLYRIAGDSAGKKSKAYFSVQPDRSATAWNSTQASDSLF